MPVFAMLTIVTAFPRTIGNESESSFALALLFCWITICFGFIAFVGRLPSGGRQRVELYLIAKKYVAGELTLEEYGEKTRELVDP